MGMHQLLDTLLIRKHRACYLKFIAMIHKIQVKSIAEIGVFRGKNAEVLREQFPDAHLYLIDPWMPTQEYLDSGSAVSEDIKVYEKAHQRVLRLFENDPKATLIQRTSQKAASLLPNHLDLVFIDANHAYESVKKDILTYRPKIRPVGILSGHNYGRKRLPGVKQAVQEILKDDFILGQDEVWLHITNAKL